MASGGQVFQIDPSYFGMYGLGQSLKGIGEDRERRKAAEVEKIYKAVQAGVMSKTDAAAALAAKYGDDYTQYSPQTTYAEQKDKRLQDIQRRIDAGEPVSEDERQLYNQAEFGTPDVQTQVEAGRVSLEKLKGDVKLGEMQRRTIAMESISRATDLWGDNTPETNKYKETLTSVLGEAALSNTVPTMESIQRKMVARLSDDPKMLEAFIGKNLFGDVRGLAGATRTANLGNQLTESEIFKNYKSGEQDAAQTAILKASGGSGESSMLKLYEPFLNATAKYVDPVLSRKYLLTGYEGLSDIDKQSINEGLAKYAAEKAQGGDSNSVAQLNALTLAASRKMPVSPDLIKTLYANIMTEATGQPHQWVKVKNTALGFDALAKDQEVLQPINPGQVGATDNMAIAQAKNEAMTWLSAGKTPTDLQAVIDGIEPGPRKDIMQQALNQILQERNAESPAENKPAAQPKENLKASQKPTQSQRTPEQVEAELVEAKREKAAVEAEMDNPPANASPDFKSFNKKRLRDATIKVNNLDSELTRLRLRQKRGK